MARESCWPFGRRERNIIQGLPISVDPLSVFHLWGPWPPMSSLSRGKASVSSAELRMILDWKSTVTTWGQWFKKESRLKGLASPTFISVCACYFLGVKTFFLVAPNTFWAILKPVFRLMVSTTLAGGKVGWFYLVSKGEKEGLNMEINSQWE